jgi:predicted PurR-regulated permease PerM
MRWIERKLGRIKKTNLRRALAILLTLVCVILVLIGVVYLLVPQLAQTVESLVATLPGFFQRMQARINEYLSENPDLMSWLTENTDFTTMNWSELIQKAVSWISNGLGAIMDGALNAVVRLSTGIFNAIMSLVFAIYCLARKEILARQGRRILYSLLPERVCDEVVRILRMTNSVFSNFISGQCLEAVILGCMFAVSMAIFQMPYISLISVMIAVMALVPIIGAFVGCIVGAFFIMVHDPVLAFWFVIMFLILQQIEGNMIYPRVVGTSIGLPGMWVLVAVAVGGDLLGIGGMLLMIPLASVLYALAREFTNKRIAERGIDPEKLQDHPPELRSNFKEKRQKSKEKRLLKRLGKRKSSDDAQDGNS